MSKKVACHLNYYPSQNPTSAPKSFNLHANSLIDTMLKSLFKNAVDFANNFMVATLSPFSNQQGFSTLIQKIPQDIPDNLYLYSLPNQQQIQYFRNIKITNRQNDTVYKFRMQAKDDMKVLNEKFKELRGEADKTPFSYRIDGVQIPPSRHLADIHHLDIEMEAVPKLVSIEIYQNSKLIWSVKIGLTHFKKTAGALFRDTIVKNLERQLEEFQNYDIYYEYNHTKIPEDGNISVKPGDTVKLHLDNRNYEYKPENTVEVEVTTENEVKKKKISMAKAQNKAPIEIASFVVNSNEQPFFNQKIEVKVDNEPFQSTGVFKKGKVIEIKFTNIKTKEPETYAIASPEIPATASQSSQFVDFKKELKRLLDEPDSDKNDISIKRLLATFMVENMFK